MTDEQKRIITELYPHYSGKEIGDKIEVNRNRVNAYAKLHGLTHTSETTARLKKKSVTMLEKGRSHESYMKAANTTRRKRQYDTFLLLSGKKQKTKLKVSILPQKTRRRITMLCHLYHYFKSDDRNSTTVYYDKETRRNAFAEKFAKEKYGITFEEADED